jgi:hypothetical protein
MYILTSEEHGVQLQGCHISLLIQCMGLFLDVVPVQCSVVDTSSFTN